MSDTLEGVLSEHEFFRDLEPRYLQTLIGCASNVRFGARETIFREGTPADRFYLIRTGKIAIEVHLPGRGALTIQTVGPGEALGWSWLFPPYRWNFDARAIEETRAFALDGQCLRGKCEVDHDLGYELMKRFSLVMIERLRATRLQLLDVYGSSEAVRT